MKAIVNIGKPIHLRVGAGATACGLFGSHMAAWDARDVECERCKKTKAYKTKMGKVCS